MSAYGINRSKQQLDFLTGGGRLYLTEGGVIKTAGFIPEEFQYWLRKDRTGQVVRKDVAGVMKILRLLGARYEQYLHFPRADGFQEGGFCKTCGLPVVRTCEERVLTCEFCDCWTEV